MRVNKCSCGAEPRLVINADDEHCIRCFKCGLTGIASENALEAIKYWNDNAVVMITSMFIRLD